MKNYIFTSTNGRAKALNSDTVIPNVAMITKGPALGHNALVDEKTLAQVVECARKFKTGVPAGVGHFQAPDKIFGYFSNARVSGNKVIGDLHFFAESPESSLVKSQMGTLGDSMGYSIFCDGADEMIDGVKHVRCDTLIQCDWVTTPAANPDGIYSRKPESSISAFKFKTEIRAAMASASAQMMSAETRLMNRLDTLSKHLDRTPPSQRKKLAQKSRYETRRAEAFARGGLI